MMCINEPTTYIEMYTLKNNTNWRLFLINTHDYYVATMYTDSAHQNTIRCNASDTQTKNNSPAYMRSKIKLQFVHYSFTVVYTVTSYTALSISEC